MTHTVGLEKVGQVVGRIMWRASCADCDWECESSPREAEAAAQEHHDEMSTNDAVVADMSSAAEPRTEGIIRQAVDLTVGSHSEPTTGPLTDTQAVDVLAAYLNG